MSRDSPSGDVHINNMEELEATRGVDPMHEGMILYQPRGPFWGPQGLKATRQVQYPGFAISVAK